MTRAIAPDLARSSSSDFRPLAWHRMRPTWRWTWDGNVFFGLNRQDRRYVDVTAWESQNWGMLAVDRPVRSTDRFTVMGDAVGRGLHHRPAGFAAAVSDRRKLQPGPARQLPAPARSADEPGRHLPLRPAGRVVHRRRRSGRHADPRTDAVHAPRLRPRQPAGAADASLPRFDAQHARRHSRRSRIGNDHARGLGLPG